MRLTKSTDIALRIAMRLAVLGEEVNPTTQQVAEAVDVSYTHAAKIVAQLCHLGVVEARRGRGGGLTLTRAGHTGSVLWSGIWRVWATWSNARRRPARCGVPAGCAARCARPRSSSTQPWTI
jgi:hypothetical protein